MTKKSLSNLIIVLVTLIIIVITIIIIVYFTQNKDNKWIPEVQGSHVSEIEYQSIDGIKVETYDDYKTFKNSELANTYIISQKPTKEERYSKEYFDDSNLAVVKFNYKYSNVKFYMTDAIFSNGVCTIKLFGAISEVTSKESDSTYSCYLETKNSVKDLSFELVIEEYHYSNQELIFIGEDNKPYTPDNSAEPIVYKINNKEGIKEFIKQDGSISDMNYIVTYLNAYSNEFFNDYSLLAIKLPSSDFHENFVRISQSDQVEITSIYTNHYKFLNQTEYYALLVLPVSKTLEVQDVVYKVYNEYEDTVESIRFEESYSLIKVELESDSVEIYKSK